MSLAYITWIMSSSFEENASYLLMFEMMLEQHHGSMTKLLS